jgi:murein DD-endopeptidase MepM/ murein hydrolase activator NlpD
MASTYLAEDIDIDLAVLAYSEWETDLQLYINNIEVNYPDYDEYRYRIDNIGHNPFEMMAFLTAVFDDFTFSQVEGVLIELFDEQYTLTITEIIEIRYRTEIHTGTMEVVDPITEEITIETYEYEVEVAYEYYILEVDLVSLSFTNLVLARMDSEQEQRFNILMATKGNRQVLHTPFDFNWLPFVTSLYGYRVTPNSGVKNLHRGLDISTPTGTPILAGLDGIVTVAGDNGAYGLLVVIQNDKGLVAKYAHCSSILVSVGQSVEVGDVIALVGSTGNSAGPHLHLEILLNGQYLNPLFYAVTNDFGESHVYDGNYESPMGDGTFEALLAEAMRHLGKPYVYGASGPNSFDCSGFVSYVLNQSGVRSFPRTNVRGLYAMTTPIPASQAQPGDLIFFQGTYSTTSPVSHIGIYLGNGQMIHAGNPVNITSINTPYWQRHFFGFGRLN